MRVAVAMSGGMDSTAAALVLKQRGFEVLGFHMRLHGDSDAAWESAQKVAAEISAPVHLVDFRQEFSSLVVKPFVEEYSRGRTPSPCPLCNRCIKMSLLFDYAASLGCEKLATGHYARVMQGAAGPELWRGKDRAKDQSYFLFELTREMLRRTMFPLGDFTKTEMREFLKREGVSIWESAESQELCFIPDGDYRRFLLEHGVADSPGNIVDSGGNVLGRHSGISRFTVGQRKGLGICGPKPLYVLRIDPQTRTVVVGPKEETYTSILKIVDVNLLVSTVPAAGDRFDVKVRSTSQAVPCTLLSFRNGSCEFRFDEPQSAVAPGQAAVLYLESRVAGGGWIANSGIY
jgi:tRNA-uridine 2-sulfurtransferase